MRHKAAHERQQHLSYCLLRFGLVVVVVLVYLQPILAQDPLPSGNDTAPKKAIIAFVERVTANGSPDFVPVPERIAMFDNDGTPWSEKPLPFKLLFAIDRVKFLAPQHPEWKSKEPFASLLKGDMTDRHSEPHWPASNRRLW